MVTKYLPNYKYSSTSENLIDLEKSDYFDEIPIRFFLSLCAIVCLSLNVCSFLRFKPPNHFKTNVALASWLMALFLQWKVLQLGKILIMAPQRVYTIPAYGANPEHYEMKLKLFKNIETTVKHIFTLQIISTGILAIARDLSWTVLLIPLVYSTEDWRFSLMLIFDFYLKLRKTPRLEKIGCVVCLTAVFLDVSQWTWLIKIVPLTIYNGLSFRVLTSKL